MCFFCWLYSFSFFCWSLSLCFFFPPSYLSFNLFLCSKEPMDIKSDCFALTLPCLLSWFKICIFRSFFFSGRTFYNCLTLFNIMGPAARLLPLTNHKGNDWKTIPLKLLYVLKRHRKVRLYL